MNYKNNKPKAHKGHCAMSFGKFGDLLRAA